MELTHGSFGGSQLTHLDDQQLHLHPTNVSLCGETVSDLPNYKLFSHTLLVSLSQPDHSRYTEVQLGAAC